MMRIRTGILASLALSLAPAPLPAGPLPDESVYQANSTWTTQDQRKMNLADLQGSVQVVSFVYTYCEHTCPTIIASLKQIEVQIPHDLRSQVRFTLVSLDPERDTPEVLRAYMQEKQLDESRWTLLNGAPGDVREFAALMGVRYRPMGTSDIAHSNMITVLDEGGVIRYQMKGLSEDIELVIDAIADAAGQGGA